MLDSLVNPVFYPLLETFGYFWTMVVLCLVITVITTVIYKYTTNQSLMKDLKEEQKALQKQVKELKNEPEKAMQVQKRMMEINSKYMMHSFKPMLFTFLPIIIFFGWMNTHLGYYPIMPNQEFEVSLQFSDGTQGIVTLVLPPGIETSSDINKSIVANSASWVLKGSGGGDYLLSFSFNNKAYTSKIKITDQKSYYDPITRVNKDGLKTITVKLKPVLMLNIGFKQFGWLGTYIIFSIFASMLLRKMLKVY
jgi:uncharacterized membrane protein (DUF106 family)